MLAVKPCNLFTRQTAPGVLEESCGFRPLSRVVNLPSNFRAGLEQRLSVTGPERIAIFAPTNQKAMLKLEFK